MRAVFPSLIAATLLGCAADEVSLDPFCANPAPLAGRFDDRARGYLVRFRAGVNPEIETARLARRYDFMPTHVYQVIPGFAAEFDDGIREQLRCESSILDVSYNGVVGL